MYTGSDAGIYCHVCAVSLFSKLFEAQNQPTMRAIPVPHVRTLAFIFLMLPLLAAAWSGPQYARGYSSKNGGNSTCRYLPGDAWWPSNQEWSSLNDTIGGRLIAGKPLAQVCYAPNLDALACG